MSGVLQEAVPGNCASPSRSGRTRLGEPGSIDGFGFDIQQPDNTEYRLGYDWPNGGRIAQLRVTTAYGQGEISVLINGAEVGGIDHAPISAGVRSRHSASADNLFSAGDDISIRFDSGAGSLLGVAGTLVVTNKSIFEATRELSSGMFEGQIPIAGDLIGALVIPIAIVPTLKRNPLHIFDGTFTKNDPAEDNVFVLNHSPFEPNDFRTGWNYNLSSGAVAGQILRYAYIK